jgi:hypothetical protein
VEAIVGDEDSVEDVVEETMGTRTAADTGATLKETILIKQGTIKTVSLSTLHTVHMIRVLSVSYALGETKIEGLRENTRTLIQTGATNSTSSVARGSAIRM